MKRPGSRTAAGQARRRGARHAPRGCATLGACSPPAPSSSARSAWRPAPTGWPRAPAWRSSNGAATPSTPPSPWRFVLHVAEPHMCGPAGDVPILRPARRRRARRALRPGPGPGRGDHRPLPGRGPRPDPAARACWPPWCPGAVPAWLTLLRDHGTWRLRDVLEPAIGYAAGRGARPPGRDGHDRVGRPPLPPPLADLGRRLPARRTRRPSRARCGAGRPSPPPGSGWWPRPRPPARDREAQIDAALTAWSSGFVAEAIDRHAAVACADGAGGHYAGVLRGDDLAAWRPGYEAPLRLAYGRYEVAQVRTVVAGPGVPAGPGPARRLRPRRRRTATAPSSCTWSPRR